MDPTSPTSSAQDSAPPTATPSVQGERPRRRWPTRVLIAIIAAVIVSQIVIWTLWEPKAGLWLKNMITYSQVMLVAFCGLIWWTFFAPVRLRIRIPALLIVLVLCGGVVAAVRDVDKDGDLNLTVRWKWEPTQAERLESFDESSLKNNQPSEALPQTDGEAMSEYRGQNRDGKISSPPILQDWQSSPPRELWRRPVGGGYSAFSILNGNAVTLEQRDDNECVVCYDSLTGEERWVYSYLAHFQEVLGGPGPRSTPTLHDSTVYTFGAFGDLHALDLKTGQLRWHINSLQQFQIPNAMWAMACSPLVWENLVIVNVGGLEGDGLIAYQLDSGKLVWHSEGLPDPTSAPETYETGAAAVQGTEGVSVAGYCSPMLAKLQDVLQILNFDGVAMRGHDPQTGKQLWKVEFVAGMNINVAQPIVVDSQRIFITGGYGEGGRMISLSHNADGEWSATVDDQKYRMRCKFTSPILYEGYLYGLDEGVMTCLNADTGERMWRRGRVPSGGSYGHGQILLVNDQILVLSEEGTAYLIDPSPEKLIEVTSFRVLKKEKTWNPPAMADGRLYVRNAWESACFDLRDPAAEAALVVK